MKMLIVILCMSCAMSIYGQQIKVELTGTGNFKDDVTDFHKYGERLYCSKTNWGKMQFGFTASLKKVKYGVELIQYSAELKELKKLSLDNGEKDFGPFSPTVYYGATAIYVMYFKFVDEDKVKMYLAKVNPDDLSLVATKEIMQYDQRNQSFWENVKTIDDTRTSYAVSLNEKNIWIVHASQKLIQSCVIDGDLNLVQKTEALPVKLEKLSLTSMNIDNDGNKVFTYRYANPQNPDFYSTGMFFQSVNAKGLFTAVKFAKGFSPGNLRLQQSKDGKRLYVAGEYYGDDHALGGKGVLLGEVNIATQSTTTPKFYPYTNELKQRILDLDFASKKGGEIVFIDHRLDYEINEMNNGTIVLSADMRTSASTSHEMTSRLPNVTFNYTGPIILAFIKPDGKVNMTLVPKKQGAGTFSNFFNYVFQDKLVCIYADLPKYQEKEFDDRDIKLVRVSSSLVPVANVYDSEGKLLSRKMLIDSEKKMKGNIMIADKSNITTNKFLLPVGESKVNMVKYYTSVNQMCYLEIF